MTLDSSPTGVLEILQSSEKDENNHLMEILAVVQPTHSSLASIVRGLHTKNSKLLSLLANCIKEIATNEDEFEFDPFKCFVNDFILWLDSDAILLFERYADLITTSVDTDLVSDTSKMDILANPVLNCKNYIKFVDNCKSLLRNPFVLDSLSGTKLKLEKVIETYHEKYETRQLNFINFDNIKPFGSPDTPFQAHNSYNSYDGLNEYQHGVNMGSNYSGTTINDSKATSHSSRKSSIHSSKNGSTINNSNVISPTKVSSLFKVDQIVERTKDAVLNLTDKNHNDTPIELVLLNLANVGDKGYNSLAILEIDTTSTDKVRSVVYPPFRLNELSVDYHDSALFLRSIDFSAKNKTERILKISSPNQATLFAWHKKLTVIFPDESNYSKEALDTFLITPSNSPSKMAGLGINVVSDSEHRRVVEKVEKEIDARFETPQKASHNRDMSINSNSPLSQLQYHFKNKSSEDRIDVRSIHSNGKRADNQILPPPAFMKPERKLSSSSSRSDDSSESVKTKYDRSMSIIQKTLSGSSLALLGDANDASNSSPIKEITRKTPGESAIEHKRKERPVSVQAEIGHVDLPFREDNSNVDLPLTVEGIGEEEEATEEYKPKPQGKSASVPDLRFQRSKNLYQLSTGSAIDISNFGKDYKPSFADGSKSGNTSRDISSTSLNSAASRTSNKTKRKSIFGIFKKPSKTKLRDDTVDGFKMVESSPESMNKSESTDSFRRDRLELKGVRLDEEDEINAITKQKSENAKSDKESSKDKQEKEKQEKELIHEKSEREKKKELEKLKKEEDKRRKEEDKLRKEQEKKQREELKKDEDRGKKHKDGLKNEKTLSEEKKALEEEKVKEEKQSKSDRVLKESLVANRTQNNLMTKSGSSNSTINTTTANTSNTINTSINNSNGSDPDSSKSTPSSVSAHSNSPEKASSIPSAFALPSSTSMYFFKQYKNGGSSTNVAGHPGSQSTSQDNLVQYSEDELVVPQDLKNLINDEPSIDFFVTETCPKAMKISKWKRKYGKWEMITVNENLFAKIVVNYEVNKSWLTFFKEEIDEEGTELDKPVLILSLIEGETTVRHTALDLQVNSINAITKEKMQIMIRCTTGALGNSILTNIKNVLGVLSANARNNNYGELKNSELSSAHVAAPSLSEKSHPSASTTYSSFNSTDDQKSHTSPSKLRQENSTYSINSEEAPNFNVIKNPDNSKLILLNNMTIRLQEQLESYEMKNTPSSWKILSMYSLSVFSITDNISKKAYFNFVLENTDKSETAEKDYNWLICDSEIDTRMERIGKAGFLVKVDDDSIFMIECKGKKQSIQLLEIFR